MRGTDSDDFTINTNGELYFSSPPNHELPADGNSDNVYEIEVVASDGSNEGTLDVTISVTEVNEGPEITGQGSHTVSENYGQVLATYSATDPEDTGAQITRWSTSGRDGGDFTINEAGELSLRNPPDFERPADSNRDNSYEFTVRAYDGRVYGTYDVTVLVEDVNEAPDFRSGSRTSFSYRENGTSALYTYRATDSEGSDITWSLRGDDAVDFRVSETGTLTFASPPDFDSPAGSGTDGNEYMVTVVATDDGTYGEGGQLTGAPLDGTLKVTVTVTDQNEEPTITDTGANTEITVQENSDQVLSTYRATDPEEPGTPVTRWSTSGRDGGDFTINEDGELTFRNPPDFERPADSNRDNIYELTVRASDGRYYGTLDVTITVEEVDEAPEFRSGSQYSFVYKENGTSAIYTYRATDPEGDDVSWSLSGTDSDAFTMSETGVLAFSGPPDYESPTDSDGNNVYEVTVEASDEQPNIGRLEVTVTVTNLTDARATITGTAQVGQRLKVDTSGITNKDSQTKTTLGYQWMADDADIEGATDPSYELTEKEEGKAVKVKVTYTDNQSNRKTLTTAPTEAVSAESNNAATGTPAITGTAQVGETLVADTSNVSDEDGLDSVTFNYQWVAEDEDIDDATGSTYEVSKEDEGKTISVRVSFTDDRGNQESLLSAVTSVVTAKANNLATGLATITGTPQVGETLTADTSGIADDDGLVDVSYRYQWNRNDGTSDSDISTATGSTYTLVAADEGKTIKVKVSFTDDAGNDETLTSAATFTVAARPNNPATGAPAVSGTAQVGETLTADTLGIADADGLSGVTFSYQWLADDADIAGATSSTYMPADGDVGKTIKVRVSFTDDANHPETLTSVATAAVAARPNSPATGAPTISGTAQVGETLTADTTGIADSDGLTGVSYSYQWIANNGNSDTDISGATGSSYTPVAADEGKTIKVRVSFTDDANHPEVRTSGSTGVVNAALTPLTVSMDNNPTNHNGTDVFTFEIRFSEEFPLSFRTLKFHVFTVTGGTVKKAQRQEQGSNIGWTITVEPDSSADVTIVLPATTDCEDSGAICTQDGRMLSNRLEFTVLGSDG